ncbi:hypothetical protein [Alishewanella tabrizica]|uniref:Orphan protein n=1 Tax=Alishewanella tabrizica TaxID=671278 RepID=A0ABQ2WR22_9ALTE|nr:hypothetical protein [Alishewanella tabrizica]GGW64009.1 hypothetical protein GCM10008111_19840 [Alishewanella tabrizica]
MNQQKSEKLKAVIQKGKWSYVLKHGVLGWGVLTAILWSAIMHFIGSIPFTESIFLALVLFSIGGVFWGLCMWFFINREFSKLEQD